MNSVSPFMLNVNSQPSKVGYDFYYSHMNIRFHQFLRYSEITKNPQPFMPMFVFQLLLVLEIQGTLILIYCILPVPIVSVYMKILKVIFNTFFNLAQG